MFLVWLISVPLVLFLVWALVADLKRRRAGRDALTDHSVDRAARKTRLEGEAKGSEWARVASEFSRGLDRLDQP